MCDSPVDVLPGGTCDAVCETSGLLHCWGSGPQMCQKSSSLITCCISMVSVHVNLYYRIVSYRIVFLYIHFCNVCGWIRIVIFVQLLRH